MSVNSNAKEIKSKMRQIKQLQHQVTSWLIDNPLQDDPQKDEMYRLAICYYKAKREKCKSQGNASYNGAMSIRLLVLVDCYNEAEGDAKQEYARKIARYLLDGTTDYWLKLIPEETKEAAFQIIVQYLEEQIRS